MSEDPGSTTLEIAVIARDPLWCAAEPHIEDLARRAAEAVFSYQGFSQSLEVSAEASIVLADDALVRDLNKTYRHQDRPTNVLAFGTDEIPAGRGGPRLLGDVVLARETVLREAEEQGKSLADHMSHLVVHGILHLLGYDHGSAAEAEDMEALEISILATLGIGNPYTEAPLEAARS